MIARLRGKPVLRDADGLVLEITDQGTGASDAALRGRGGIGLGNTRERLDALYGSAASLHLVNMPGAGVRVTVRLPVRSAEPA